MSDKRNAWLSRRCCMCVTLFCKLSCASTDHHDSEKHSVGRSGRCFCGRHLGGGLSPSTMWVMWTTWSTCCVFTGTPCSSCCCSCAKCGPVTVSIGSRRYSRCCKSGRALVGDERSPKPLTADVMDLFLTRGSLFRGHTSLNMTGPALASWQRPWPTYSALIRRSGVR